MLIYQYPVASQQNTANHFSLLWDNPISRRSIDILSENSKWKNTANANIKTTGESTSNMDETVKC